ncbi:hypothetical protein L1049_017562 [Liquidambar formosana]|uniref:EF-hand domain-containing protein n=1 Tax=Liquidambar formosana TaxID=63359 RepID=A0AAP0X3T5_LIQFO
MEEMHETALAYYENGTQEEKQLAWQFFKSVDLNGDGRVSLQELIQFFVGKGCSAMGNPKVFRELDQNGDGSLDFNEFLTLSYIATFGRPSCDGCGDFIKGVFFTCVECYECNSTTTFDLCIACYRGDKFNHAHAVFADNFMLFRQNGCAWQKSANTTQSTQANYTSPMATAFKVLKTGAKVGVDVALIASACSIM